MDRDAVILEVGLNEATTRAQNADVAYSPAECVEDARRCAEAGAAIVHWHARDPESGEQRLGDVELSSAALAGMRATGLLAYPSYPVDVPVERRLDHVWELRRRDGLELAPIDIGSVSTVLWDERSRALLAVETLRGDGVVANPLTFTIDALERARDLSMWPTLGAFDVGFTRTMVLLHEDGRLAAPVLHKIFLSGSWAVGPFPSEAALDLHLAQIPDHLDVEWLVVPYSLSDPALVERLCRYAIERGGGIRVGIGDNPAAHAGRTNAALVEEAEGWCRDAGRPLATPAELRARLGLPQ